MNERIKSSTIIEVLVSSWILIFVFSLAGIAFVKLYQSKNLIITYKSFKIKNENKYTIEIKKNHFNNTIIIKKDSTGKIVSKRLLNEEL
jgi:hypothetical protein